MKPSNQSARHYFMFGNRTKEEAMSWKRTIYGLMLFSYIVIASVSGWIGYEHGKGHSESAFIDRICQSPARYEAMAAGASCSGQY